MTDKSAREIITQLLERGITGPSTADAIGGGGEHGECYDPSKIIYDRNGNRAQDTPYVHAMYTCCEWTDAAAESDANLPTAADVRGILKDTDNG